MKYTIQIVLAFAIFNFCSCGNDSMDTSLIESVEIDNFREAQLLFSTIEYDLYMENKQLASTHVNSLLNNIKSKVKTYDKAELVIFHGLLEDIELYAFQILHESEQWSLEQLRDLKGQFITMGIKGDYNPYLINLWRYEEVMFYATKAAIDPMLDLYEWGEFQMLINCMNQEWESVNSHSPSIELFESNSLSYKIQTLAKIRLQESMDRFNTAVKSDDYIKYDLCDHGVALRESYVLYLKTIVDQQNELKPHLANL